MIKSNKKWLNDWFNIIQRIQLEIADQEIDLNF